MRLTNKFRHRINPEPGFPLELGGSLSEAHGSTQY